MATATVEKKQVPVMTEQTAVTLSLSVEEARTLRTIFNLVGGDPDKSRRKHCDDMEEALRQARIHPGSGIPRQYHLFFEDDLELFGKK